MQSLAPCQACRQGLRLQPRPPLGIHQQPRLRPRRRLRRRPLRAQGLEATLWEAAHRADLPGAEGPEEGSPGAEEVAQVARQEAEATVQSTMTSWQGRCCRRQVPHLAHYRPLSL